MKPYMQENFNFGILKIHDKNCDNETSKYFRYSIKNKQKWNFCFKVSS